MPRPRISPRRHALDAAAFGLLYLSLAIAVRRRHTASVDARVRRDQPHPRRGARRSIAEGIKVAGKPPVQLPVAALVTWALRRRGLRGADAVLASAVASYLVDKSSKRLVPRRRPPSYRGDEGDQSFPSGHTAAAAALSFATSGVLQQAGLLRSPIGSVGALTLTALVGESRLLLDEHWPSDVLAGALLGHAAASGALAAFGDHAGRGRRSR